jgi:TIR domain
VFNVDEVHRDFFITYTSADRAWAEWIAWELETAGYTTLIQAWDFRPAIDWAIKMQEGATEWSRVLAVLSPRFFESKYTKAEWSSAFARDPTGDRSGWVRPAFYRCTLVPKRPIIRWNDLRSHSIVVLSRPAGTIGHKKPRDRMFQEWSSSYGVHPCTNQRD